MNSEINKTISFLEKGKIILCPSDTLWGVSCDATNFDAVENIYKIKKRQKSKSLIVLVSSFKMLQEYILELPDAIDELLSNFEKPTTVIYNKAKNLASNTLAENGSIGIRIVKDGFCHELIKKYGKPIVSSSANFSNKKTPKTFKEIDVNLISSVDFVVNTKYSTNKNHSSTIVKIVDGEIIILRN